MTNSAGRRDEGEIRGDRTVVRPANEDDADLLVHWLADPDVAREGDDKQTGKLVEEISQ